MSKVAVNQVARTHWSHSAYRRVRGGAYVSEEQNARLGSRGAFREDTARLKLGLRVKLSEGRKT